MTFGEKLSKLRKEKNYTQEQLGDLLSVSRQSVSKWELDIAYPETEKLIEISSLFGCSMDYLLKEEATEKNSVTSTGFFCKVKKIIKKVMTENNKIKLKKALKIIGIIFVVFFIVDVISMALYFSFFGIPK